MVDVYWCVWLAHIRSGVMGVLVNVLTELCNQPSYHYRLQPSDTATVVFDGQELYHLDQK